MWNKAFQSVQKPKKRSAARLAAGRTVFTCKRHMVWCLRPGGIRFARRCLDTEALSVPVFAHQTPLLRQLKDVDMRLQHNKIINLKIAVPKIDGVVIHPGETFSYWRLTGKPAGRKGYPEGLVLKNGVPVAGIGGGLCQLSRQCLNIQKWCLRPFN